MVTVAQPSVRMSVEVAGSQDSKNVTMVTRSMAMAVTRPVTKSLDSTAMVKAQLNVSVTLFTFLLC